MTNRRMKHAQDAFSNSNDPDQQQLVFTLAIIEMTGQLKRIADSLERKREPAQAKDGPFDSAQDYGDYEPQPVEQLGISGAPGYDSVPSVFDPMEPDYEALAADEPTSQIQDSRDSAGFPNP